MTSPTRLRTALLLVLAASLPGVVTLAARARQAGAASQPDPALVLLPIPDRVEDILAQMKTRDMQVGELIAKGNFAAVYVPAFQAKDLAIALEGRLDTLAPAPHDAASFAIHELVRLAWLLDAAGDLGNRQELVTAHEAFSSRVTEIVAAFGG